MANQEVELSQVFHALADPTRRAVLARLSEGPGSTSELAEPFAMAFPTFTQHMALLERSGLVRSRKVGRVRTYELAPRPLELAETWLSARRRFWEARLDRLDDYLRKLAQGPNAPARRKKERLS